MTMVNGTDDLKKAVENTVSKLNQQIRSRAYSVQNVLRNAELEVLSGQRSGKVYRKPGTKSATYTASAPGEPPARRLGSLRKHWTQGIDGNLNASGGVDIVAYIESTTPYSGYLENGTRKMAARPYVERIKEKAKPEIIKIMSGGYTN